MPTANRSDTPPDASAAKLFGWQGISCSMPDNWDLASVTGRQKSGYFAFDDERTRRLEIKYDQARRWGQPVLEKTLEYYFESVRKKLRKRVSFNVEYNVKLNSLERIPEEYEYRTYGWTSDLVARGIIWLCPTCRRVVIAQCLARPNRVSIREMSDVLVSIRCHAEGDSQTWAVFDHAVDVPKRLMLERNNLRAGLISLTFSGGRERLVVDRLGMASAVLKQTPMDEYVKTVHYRKLKRRRLRFIEEPWHGHDGFRIEGERFRLMYLLPHVGPFVRRLRTADHVAGRVWVSPEANRLFIIRAEGKHSRQLADEVAESIEAHLDTAATV